MEDKRIAKTRQNLRGALVALAGEKAFEQITVTELCKRANTSRITFYAHYDDKFQLLDEVFETMRASASKEFYRLQRENNRENDEVQSYCNLMNCILDTYFGQTPLFSHATPYKSPYLFYKLHSYIEKNVVDYVERWHKSMPHNLPLQDVVVFLSSGLWAVMWRAQSEGRPLDEARADAEKLLRAFLQSGALQKLL